MNYAKIASAEEFAALRMSEDPQDYLRAAHATASLQVWRDVIARFPQLRAWVAHNKTVPLEILAELAADDDPDVRFTVAMKRKISSEICEMLGTDPDPAIRAQVARHRRTPVPTLFKLAADPELTVREAARMSIGTRRPA